MYHLAGRDLQADQVATSLESKLSPHSDTRESTQPAEEYNFETSAPMTGTAYLAVVHVSTQPT